MPLLLVLSAALTRLQLMMKCGACCWNSLCLRTMMPCSLQQHKQPNLNSVHMQPCMHVAMLTSACQHLSLDACQSGVVMHALTCVLDSALEFGAKEE